MNRSRFTQYALTAAALISSAGVVPLPDGDAVTPVADRCGWSPNLAQLVDDAPPEFALQGAPDGYSSAGEQVLLWKYTQAINGGQHAPSLRQQVGDCVAFGATHGLIYTQAAAICRDVAYRRFRVPYPPYIYGTSRVQIGGGRLGGSDGSVGSWAVKALVKYGALPADEPGVPAYSGSVSRQWGRSGPPQRWLEVGDDFPLQAYAQVKNYEQARDAIANGYAVTVASMQGFANGREVEKSGVLWGVPRGSWAHQMCFIGVDDNLVAPDGSQGGLYCLNSWGASSHRTPIRGEPPGGFWVSSRVANAMLRQNDSWALSGFEGFPVTDDQLDLSVFRMNVEFPEQADPLVPIAEQAGLPAGGPTSGTAAALAGTGAWYLRRRRRKVSQQLAA